MRRSTQAAPQTGQGVRGGASGSKAKRTRGTQRFKRKEQEKLLLATWPGAKEAEGLLGTAAGPRGALVSPGRAGSGDGHLGVTRQGRRLWNTQLDSSARQELSQHCGMEQETGGSATCGW